MKECPFITASRIADFAEQLGYQADGIVASSMSCSHYLYLAKPEVVTYFNGKSELVWRETRIRISDHELPGEYEDRYGTPDYEVGEWDGIERDWLDCVLWLASELGAPLTTEILDAQTRREKLLKKAA